MIQKSIWILLSKYFAGECNEDELVKLDNWLSKKKTNHLLFNELQRDKELIGKYKEMKTVDVDKAWNKLSRRIEATGYNNVRTMISSGKDRNRVKVPFLIWFAASILIVAGLLVTYKSLSTRSNFETIAAANKNTTFTLPDGSVIILNRDSKIVYPKDFGIKQRELILKGEAFFEVTHDNSKPFIVKADEARIKVIGTSFAVNERAGKNGIEVYVENGRVSLYKEEMEHAGVMIDPGYIGQLSGNLSTKYLNKNNNILAWKTRKIIFTDTKLSEVIKVLEKVYGKEIIIENKEALNWPYTGTFDNQDLESVTKVLVENYQFGIEQDRNKIVLTGGNSGI